MNGRSLVAIGAVLLLAACQLPLRQDDYGGLNAQPQFDTSSIIDSSNGLLGDNIASIPGKICRLNDRGLCDREHLLSGNYSIQGAKVIVKPAQPNVTPMYHSLINDKYSASGTLPFVKPAISSEYLNEVKAVEVGSAAFDPASTSNDGRPDTATLKKMLARDNINDNVVYFLAAANIIAVTTQQYKQVSSSADVTADGFGFSGSTYSHVGTDGQNIYIGINAYKVYLTPQLPGPGLLPPRGGRALVAPAERAKGNIFDVDEHGQIR